MIPIPKFFFDNTMILNCETAITARGEKWKKMYAVKNLFKFLFKEIK